MKVSKELYKQIGTVKGEDGDLVEDFDGNRYIICSVEHISGINRNNYWGMNINNKLRKEYLYDMYLRCNYGKDWSVKVET